ncbi:MAG: PQQ-binding-like beta-propeller repeat protein [Polyangiaceae bacterium]|nr:PQQ-binding-like beta-propeller repeat protein [Polyangiaceae bacterium]
MKSQTLWFLAFLAGCGAAGENAEVSQPTHGDKGGATSSIPVAVPGPQAVKLDVATAGLPAFLSSSAVYVPAFGNSPSTEPDTYGTPAPLGVHRHAALSSDATFAIVASYSKIGRINPTTGKLVWEKEQDEVRALAVSPDGASFILVTDKDLLLCKSADGSIVRTLASDAHLSIENVAISTDGKRVAYAESNMGSVVVLDVASGRKLQTVGSFGFAATVVFSPSGNRVCAASSGKLRLWDVSSGYTLFTDETSGARGCAFLQGSDSLIASGEAHGTIVLRDIEAGSQSRLTLPGAWDVHDVESVGKSPLLVVNHRGPYLSVLDTSKKVEMARLEGNFTEQAISADGTKLLGFGGQNSVLYHLPSLTSVVSAAGHLGDVQAVALSGDRLITGSRDGTTVIWNLTTRTPLARLFGFVDSVTSVSGSPHGHVAFGGNWGDAYVVDPDLKTVRAHYTVGENAARVAFSPDGKYLMISPSGRDGRYSNEALLINTATWEVQHRYPEVDWDTASFYPSRDVVAMGPDPVQLIHLPTGTLLRGSKRYVGEGGMRIGIYQNWLLGLDGFGQPRAWVFGADPKRIDTVGWPSSFSPTGGTFLTDRGDHIAVRSLSSGAQVAKISGFLTPKVPFWARDDKFDKVLDIQFSADGSKVGVGYSSGVARMFAAPRPASTTGELFGTKVVDLKGLADLSTIDPEVFLENSVIKIDVAERHIRLDPYTRMTVSADGAQAAVVGQGFEQKAQILDTLNGSIKRTSVVSSNIESVRFHASGRLLIIAEPSSRDHAEAIIIGATQKQDSTVALPDPCKFGALAPKDDILCLGSNKRLYRKGSKVGADLPYRYSQVFAASADGGLAAYGTENGAKLLLVDSFGIREGKALSGLLGTPSQLAFSPDKKWLAASGEGGGVILNIEKGAVAHIFEGQDKVTALAFSPDNTLLATASKDRTIRVWNVTTGQLKWVVHSKWSVEDGVGFAKDSNTVLTLGNGHLAFWKL